MPAPSGAALRAKAPPFGDLAPLDSRALYIEFTRSMRLETLVRCHQNAFAYFGGWTARILYDNMRQVIVRPGLVNPRFRDFADYHGFEPKAHRPYRPRTKGKVERMVS